MIADHGFDHLPDRQRLTSATIGIAGKEPIEAAVRIVFCLLLGQQEHKTIAISQGRPTRTDIIGRRALVTAMENHHQGAFGLDGNVFEHSENPGIRTETLNLGQVIVLPVQVELWRVLAVR